MTLKKYFLIVALLVAQSAFAVAEAREMRMTLVENALEIEKLKIALNDGENGFVMDDQARFEITPETRAIEDGKVVELARAKERFGKSASVFYDIKTLKVTKISWTSN